MSAKLSAYTCPLMAFIIMSIFSFIFCMSWAMNTVALTSTHLSINQFGTVALILDQIDPCSQFSINLLAEFIYIYICMYVCMYVCMCATI